MLTTSSIVAGICGNLTTRYMILKLTAKTATVIECDCYGDPLSYAKPIRRKLDYSTGASAPSLAISPAERVYLAEPAQLETREMAA